MKKSVKELRRIAMEKAVNTNHCIEKRELVNAILNAEEQHINSEEITISPETIQIISDSSDHSSLCDSHMSANGQPLTEYSSDDYSEIGSSRRTHRKSNNPNRRKSKSALWHGVDIINVQHLPYDIDGLVAYRLAFNRKKWRRKDILQCSKDMGIREGRKLCDSLSQWGIHACEARKTVNLSEEKLKKKFEANSKTTPRQAADDIIIEALVKEDMRNVCATAKRKLKTNHIHVAIVLKLLAS